MQGWRWLVRWNRAFHDCTPSANAFEYGRAARAPCRARRRRRDDTVPLLQSTNVDAVDDCAQLHTKVGGGHPGTGDTYVIYKITDASRAWASQLRNPAARRTDHAAAPTWP